MVKCFDHQQGGGGRREEEERGVGRGDEEGERGGGERSRERERVRTEEWRRMLHHPAERSRVHQIWFLALPQNQETEDLLQSKAPSTQRANSTSCL